MPLTSWVYRVLLICDACSMESARPAEVISASVIASDQPLPASQSPRVLKANWSMCSPPYMIRNFSLPWLSGCKNCICFSRAHRGLVGCQNNSLPWIEKINCTFGDIHRVLHHGHGVCLLLEYRQNCNINLYSTSTF